MNKRVGLYAWGGPGTIDLLKQKYHKPKIDEKSYYDIYSDKFLSQAKEKLGLTDIWMSYSWGFSSHSEAKHKDYIRQILPNIKKYDFTTYGYVQGLNVVTSEFKSEDIFCKSPLGHKLPYSKNRHLICPNNPNARQLLTERVLETSRQYFENVFMDNIMFGLPPFYVSRGRISSFGCHCNYCQKEFQKSFGYSLPKTTLHRSQKILDIINFRVNSTADLIKNLSGIARGMGKGFGINLYDPLHHVSEIYFGYSLEKIEKYLDYYLIENHAIGLDSESIDNRHLQQLINNTQKPVFVVSYQKGIGVDAQYPQKFIDLIFSESEFLGYSPCLKASEFITNNTWHTLKLDELNKPETFYFKHKEPPKTSEALPPKPISSALVRAINAHAPKIIDFIYHNNIAFELLKKTGLYTKYLRKSQYFDYNSYKK